MDDRQFSRAWDLKLSAWERTLTNGIRSHLRRQERVAVEKLNGRKTRDRYAKWLDAMETKAAVADDEAPVLDPHAPFGPEELLASTIGMLLGYIMRSEEKARGPQAGSMAAHIRTVNAWKKRRRAQHRLTPDDDDAETVDTGRQLNRYTRNEAADYYARRGQVAAVRSPVAPSDWGGPGNLPYVPPDLTFTKQHPNSAVGLGQVDQPTLRAKWGKNLGEVMHNLSTKFPNIAFGVEDPPESDSAPLLASWYGVGEALEDLKGAYPNIFDTLSEFDDGEAELGRGVVADTRATDDGVVIRFSPAHADPALSPWFTVSTYPDPFGKPKLVQRTARNPGEGPVYDDPRYLSVRSAMAYGVVVHEFGHVADFNYAGHVTGRTDNTVEFEPPGTFVVPLVHDPSLDSDPKKNVNVTGDGWAAIGREAQSPYGSTQPQEFQAEAFSSRFLGAKSQYIPTGPLVDDARRVVDASEKWGDYWKNHTRHKPLKLMMNPGPAETKALYVDPRTGDVTPPPPVEDIEEPTPPEPVDPAPPIDTNVLFDATAAFAALHDDSRDWIGAIMGDFFHLADLDVRDSTGAIESEGHDVEHAFLDGDPHVVDAIEGQAARMANTVQTTKRALDDTLAEGQAQGETLDQLTARVHTTFAKARDVNAPMIATTESNVAANTGAYLAAWQSGMKLRKKWLTMLDSRVRDAHRTTEGQERPLEQPFLVGGHPMMFPGDPSAPLSLTVNCRCHLRYIPVVPNPPVTGGKWLWAANVSALTTFSDWGVKAEPGRPRRLHAARGGRTATPRTITTTGRP